MRRYFRQWAVVSAVCLSMTSAASGPKPEGKVVEVPPGLIDCSFTSIRMIRR